MKPSSNTLIFTISLLLFIIVFSFLAWKILSQIQNRPLIPERTVSYSEPLPAFSLLETKKVRPFGSREVHKLLLLRTKQKEGVYLGQLRPEMDTAGIKIVFIYHEVLGDDYVPWITSGNDYEYHTLNSAHYRNMALDFRLKKIPRAQKKAIVEKVKVMLGERFFVLHEDPGGENEHLHVELRIPRE